MALPQTTARNAGGGSPSSAAAHSTDGTKGVGPSWKAGTEVELADGRKVPRDLDYLARAIQDPDAEIPAG